MLSEWLRIMLEEIARKDADAELARQELERREQDQVYDAVRDDQAGG